MKRVSLATLDAIVKGFLHENGSKESLTFGDITIEFTVKKNLTLLERSMFVSRVIDGSFAGDEFISEYVDAMKATSFYQYFTNLPVPSLVSDNGGATNHLDIQRTYDFCAALGLVQKMCEKYPQIKAIYDNLCECSDRQIEFKKQQILSQEHSVLSRTAEQMENLSEQLGELFAGFDVKDLSAAIKNVSEIDRGAVIDAIVKRTNATNTAEAEVERA